MKNQCFSRLLFPQRIYAKKGINMSSRVTLPKQLPVMPLPGAVLFPHALLPLYIFEPRYRNMLEHALHHHRMFCITLIKPSCPDWHAPEDFFHLATAGLIRACVGRADGTSNLVRRAANLVEPYWKCRLCRTRRRHFQFGSTRFAARPFQPLRTRSP